MQFRLIHLFLIILVFAILTVAIQYVIERQPSMSGMVVLVLASPALMGLGIIAVSLAQIARSAGSGEHSSAESIARYRSLACIGLFATMPILIYVFYCFIYASS